MSLPARRLPQNPEALAELLRSGQLRKAAPAGAPRVLETGHAALDAALGGGLWRGQLHEIVAPPGAGGTALLRAALSAATQAGELCALIDPADSFDPAHGGIALERLLWVRPAEPAQALRAAEIALEARFALVAVDLGELGQARRAPPGEVRVVRFAEEKRRSLGASPWARLARRAERHGGALLVLARQAQAGTFALATIELERERVLWEGHPGDPGRFLRGAAAVGAVARHKRLAPSAPLRLSLPASHA